MGKHWTSVVVTRNVVTFCRHSIILKIKLYSMSLQWTLVATFLYVEIAVVILLILPIISAARWQKIFRSRLLSFFTHYSNLYFNILIVILLVLFLDSIREIRKYENIPENVTMASTPAAEISFNMKLFRAQRNFYIAGFSLVLFFVLRKLVVFVSKIATLEADVIATKKQAESASAAAKQMMEKCDNVANEKASTESSTDSNEINQLKKDLANTNIELQKSYEDLSKSQVDLAAIKKQAESTSKEYDRLLSEYSVLQGMKSNRDFRESNFKLLWIISSLL